MNLRLQYASLKTGARLEFCIPSWEFKTPMLYIMSNGEKFTLVDSQSCNPDFNPRIDFHAGITFVGEDLESYHTLLRQAFISDDPVIELIKPFYAKHFKPEMHLFSKLPIAIGMGDQDQIEFEYHRIRPALRSHLPDGSISMSRWWLYRKTGDEKYLDYFQKIIVRYNAGERKEWK